MKALEKAARAHCAKAGEISGGHGRFDELFPEVQRVHCDLAKAVISSIEVNDAMVEAVLDELHTDWRKLTPEGQSNMRTIAVAVSKAALHSILVDGEGR